MVPRLVRAWVVAGPAGAGKSTLGRALAERTGAALLDLDTLTNPLLDALDLDPHWNAPSWRAVVRPARYAALRSVAGEQVRLGLDVVLVAPFTAELVGGPEWRQLTAALEPARVDVVWLRAPASLLASRVAARGEPRDDVVAPAPAVDPAVPHLVVDAALPTAEQVQVVVGDRSTWSR